MQIPVYNDAIYRYKNETEWMAIIDLDEKNIEPNLYLMHHIDDLSAKFGVIKAEMLPYLASI